MPELPEVQTTVDGINKKVLLRTFVDVWSDWEKMIKKPKDFREFKKLIIGKKIIKAWRRAKNVIINLSDGYSLLIHQKMTGHLLFGKWFRQERNLTVARKTIWTPEDKKSPLNDPYNRFLHIIFFLDNGKMLALSDSRKFAKVELWKTNELLNSTEFKKIGPEPLDKNFNFKKFKKALENKRGKIKAVLMNPEIIAGIGNIYANEALWYAKIHPQKDVANLSQKELKSLYQSVIKVLKRGVELGGESFSDYRNIEGGKGNFDDERRVYKREGQECRRCKTKIKRIKFNGRSSFFCPICQILK